jgi:oligopeptide transport system permease protein
LKSKRQAEHFVASLDEVPVPAADSLEKGAAPLSFWADARRKLCSSPLFIVSSFMILLIIVVVLFPGLFTHTPPDEQCFLANSNGPPAPGHPMGFTFQGCDVYSRVIHGTQASVAVGLLSVSSVLVIGVPFGALAGYYGGWIDAVLARIGDMVFALPLLLGALVITRLPLVRENKSVWTVVLVISMLAWPRMARVVRGTVIRVKNMDFVTAARSLGVSNLGILIRHVLPNAVAPIMVLASLELGSFIGTEATLSFLGIGLPESVTSWGHDIAAAQQSIRTNAMVLICPASTLAVTVLTFIVLGDALGDALRPNGQR